MIILKSRISLKLGTIGGCGETKITVLNSLGFTGTPLKMTKSTHFCMILANFGVAVQQVKKTTSNLINVIIYVYQT